MLRSWWTSLLGTKRCKIAVCSPSINHGRWVLTCSHGCLWILNCNLRNQKNKIKTLFFLIRQTNEKNIDIGKCHRKTYKGSKEERKWAYKTVTLGSPSVFIRDNNSLQDLTKLLKIPSHCIPLSLPSQPTNKDFG